MELAIAHLETPYALAVRAANDGIWDWDLVAETISFSPRWHAILGRPHPGATSRPLHGLTSCIPPTRNVCAPPSGPTWMDAAPSCGPSTACAMRTALALGPHLFSPALSAADTAALLARWRPAEVVALLSAA